MDHRVEWSLAPDADGFRWVCSCGESEEGLSAAGARARGLAHQEGGLTMAGRRLYRVNVRFVLDEGEVPKAWDVLGWRLGEHWVEFEMPDQTVYLAPRERVVMVQVPVVPREEES